MIYAIGDVHGDCAALRAWVDYLGGPGRFAAGERRMVLLGDYIDRGPESRQTLELVRELTETGNVIALKGNHDQLFLDFLDGRSSRWVPEDSCGGRLLNTTRTFLRGSQLAAVRHTLAGGGAAQVYDYIRRSILKNYGPLISWLRRLPLYYDTDQTIFVHAGVREEAGEDWKWGTEDYVFMEMYPPPMGKFYKTIVAGHCSASALSGDPGHQGVYFDGESHYYIAEHARKKVLCLACDEERRLYRELHLN